MTTFTEASTTAHHPRTPPRDLPRLVTGATRVSPDDAVGCILFCLGFFGFLRSGEFTYLPVTGSLLTPRDVAVDSHVAPSHLTIFFLKKNKNDPFAAGTQHSTWVLRGMFSAQSRPCWHTWQSRPSTQGPLFCLLRWRLTIPPQASPRTQAGTRFGGNRCLRVQWPQLQNWSGDDRGKGDAGSHQHSPRTYIRTPWQTLTAVSYSVLLGACAYISTGSAYQRAALNSEIDRLLT